jgi:hypothetical protein
VPPANSWTGSSKARLPALSCAASISGNSFEIAKFVESDHLLICPTRLSKNTG